MPGLLKFGDRDTLGRGRYWKVVLPSWGCGGHHWKFHLGNLRQLGCCPLVRRLVLHDFRKATESLPSRKCVKNRSTLLGDVSIWLSLLLVTSLEGVQPSVRATIRDHNSSTVQAYEDALRWRSGYSPLRHPLVRVLVYVAFGAYSPPTPPPPPKNMPLDQERQLRSLAGVGQTRPLLAVSSPYPPSQLYCAALFDRRLSEEEMFCVQRMVLSSFRLGQRRYSPYGTVFLMVVVAALETHGSTTAPHRHREAGCATVSAAQTGR